MSAVDFLAQRIAAQDLLAIGNALLEVLSAGMELHQPRQAVQMQRPKALPLPQRPVFVHAFQQLAAIERQDLFDPPDILLAQLRHGPAQKGIEVLSKRLGVQPVLALPVEPDLARIARDQIGARAHIVRFQQLPQPPDRRRQAAARPIGRVVHPKHVHEHIPRHQVLVQEQVGEQRLHAAGELQRRRSVGMNDLDLPEKGDLQCFHDDAPQGSAMLTQDPLHICSNTLICVTLAAALPHCGSQGSSNRIATRAFRKRFMLRQEWRSGALCLCATKTSAACSSIPELKSSFAESVT